MSETDFLKLKKHDNVETNTEKFDIENYLNGNWDKIDENVGEVNTNISNIKKEQETQNTNIEENNSKIVELQTEKAKLETELKEMQEDFYQNSIRGQASGEYIHVEDSSNCRAKIGIGGNNEQETRSGKNRIKSMNSDLPKTWVSPATGYAKMSVYYDDDFINNYTQGFTIKVKAKNILDTAFSKFILGNTNWSRRVQYTEFSQRGKDGYKIYEYYTTNTNFELLTSHDFIMVFEDHSQKTGCDLYDVEVDLGNTVGQDFEAYGVSPSPDYPSEVQTVGSNGSVKVTKCNKNLFDKDKYRDINKWSNSQNFFTYCKLDEEDTKKFKKIITGNMYLKKTLQKLVFGISTTNNGSSFNNQYRMLDNGNIKNITYDFSDAKEIYLCIGNSNKINVNKDEINLIFDNYDIQFEEGSTPTSYEQHQEQSYIMPVQQEMLEGDYFDFENEEEVHVWKKHEVTGNENWIKSSSDFSSKNIFSAYLQVTDMEEKSKIYCSHFKNSIDITKQYIYVPYSNILVVGISRDIANDITAFKTWLKTQYDAGTPVVVYYKLAIPNRLKFTDEQKSVAKELNNARTYKNVTNITTDSIAILSLDYAKDLETLLNNTQALAVNNASEGV